MASVLKDFHLEDVRGKHLLVALSGGADSVALLHLLHASQADYGLQITAAHLNHSIRGKDADEDTAYCRDICTGLKIPLIEEKLDVPGLARAKQIGLETAAREARYRFLREAQVRCGADLIALAHHMDDQAETILMHLLRGAGPMGVCGMPRLKDGLFRPLLSVRKCQLREYLEEAGIAWREDASNAVCDTPRNALRLNVLPEVEKSYPRAGEAIARYGRIARIESDFIDRLTDSFMRSFCEYGPYGARILLEEDFEEALLRRGIRRICGDKLCSEKLDELIVLARERRGKLSVFKGLIAEKTPHALYFLREDAKIPEAAQLALPGETLLPGICRIAVEEGSFDPRSKPAGCEIVNGDILAGAQLRTRREGDRIRPLGMRGDRLLSDYLTDKKIDRPLRDFLPLIARENRVLWVGGAGISQDAAVTDETKRRMRITKYDFTEE